MDINTNPRIICLDSQQYQDLLEMASWGAKENGCRDRLERVERHVSKYNEGMPREYAVRNHKRVLREQIEAKKIRALAGSEGRGKIYYVTGRWKGKPLYVPVTIKGRGELLPFSSRQIVVELVKPSPKLMEALLLAHRFGQDKSLPGSVFNYLRPIQEAIVHMFWTHRQYMTTHPKPYFNVTLYHLIDTLPEGATEVSMDVHHGTVDYIFSGCYVGPETTPE